MNAHPPGPRGIALNRAIAATGKSTVGRILADRLGREFADADDVIERSEVPVDPIRAIFDQDKEPAFRSTGDRTTGHRRARRPASPAGILATRRRGGPVRGEPARAIRDFGFVVWLSADPTTLARSARPLAVNGVRDRPPLSKPGVIWRRSPDKSGVEDCRSIAKSPTPRSRRRGGTPSQVADAVLEAWAATGAGSR